jgi:hypothetical protein
VSGNKVARGAVNAAHATLFPLGSISFPLGSTSFPLGSTSFPPTSTSFPSGSTREQGSRADQHELPGTKLPLSGKFVPDAGR